MHLLAEVTWKGGAQTGLRSCKQLLGSVFAIRGMSDVTRKCGPELLEVSGLAVAGVSCSESRGEQ